MAHVDENIVLTAEMVKCNTGWIRRLFLLLALCWTTIVCQVIEDGKVGLTQIPTLSRQVGHLSRSSHIVIVKVNLEIARSVKRRFVLSTVVENVGVVVVVL